MTIKLGSLFDGAGGFPFAAQHLGIKPVWASEIEPFPIAVTRKRFPDMKHLGDVSQINGAEIEPVDVLTFGSPCQSVSVAGKREGAKHTSKGDEETTRSGLFYEAIRIITEMREATNGRYPRVAVLENVPGFFSSASGEDWRLVLEAFCKVKDRNAHVPRPKGGKWADAGAIVGDGYSVAWRVLDAQYWGVPQRRRRIFLVADFGSSTGAERVLFERDGLRRNFAECRASWKGITKSLAFRADAEERTACRDVVAIEGNGSRPSHKGNGYSEDDVSYTLNSVDRHAVCCLNPWDAQSARVYAANGIWHSLNANESGGQSRDAVFAFACNQRDEVRDLGDKAGAIQAQPGMKQQTFLAVFGKGTRPHSADEGQEWKIAKIANTLNTFDVGESRANELVVEIFDARGNGDGQFVCYALDRGQEIVCYLTPVEIVLRRLTPTECARLQGMPDWYCDGLENPDPTEEEMAFWREVFETHRRVVTQSSKPKTDKQIRKWLANPVSDAAQYKMWGNGMALPCVMYVMEGVKEALEKEEEHE